MPDLTKQRVVLDFWGPDNEARLGFGPAEEMEIQSPEIYVPFETWLNMGQPSQLTITIEPGDTLNGD